MKTFVQCVVFVAGGVLTCQPFLAVSAQEMAPSPVVTRPSTSSSERIAGTGSEGSGQTLAGVPAKKAATSPGQADGKGDPALGGERHPLYRLSKLDTLDINFTFSPEFNQSLTIQPDGFVVLRGVGLLFAEGKTVADLREEVAKAYLGYLHDPEVTVTLKEFDKPYFLASGEVARPGKYELREDLTVNEALAIAGGLTKSALHSQVVLFRRISLDVAESHVIDAKKMLKSRDLREDWHLKSGDFIYVPQSRISKIRRFVPASSVSGYLNPVQF